LAQKRIQRRTILSCSFGAKADPANPAEFVEDSSVSWLCIHHSNTPSIAKENRQIQPQFSNHLPFILSGDEGLILNSPFFVQKRSLSKTKMKYFKNFYLLL